MYEVSLYELGLHPKKCAEVCSLTPKTSDKHMDSILFSIDTGVSSSRVLLNNCLSSLLLEVYMRASSDETTSTSITRTPFSQIQEGIASHGAYLYSQ